MSSSKSSSKTDQINKQQGVDGVITGTVLQGDSININQEFPDAVADAFSELIGLAQSGIQFGSDAGSAAVDVIAETRWREEQPILSTQEKFIPVLTLGLIVVGVVGFVYVLRKK